MLGKGLGGMGYRSFVYGCYTGWEKPRGSNACSLARTLQDKYGNAKPQLLKGWGFFSGLTHGKSFQWETTGVDYCDYTSKAKALPQGDISEREALLLDQ